jgi:hypothetical protein
MLAPLKSSSFARRLLLFALLLLIGCGRSAEMSAAAAPQSPSGYAAAPEAPPESEGEYLAAEESAELDSLSSDASPHAKSEAPSAPPARPAAAVPEKPAAGKAQTPELAPAPQANATLAANAEKTPPLLIYTANVHMAVFGTAQALDDVEALARRHKGYLVKRADSSITIRVPAEAFEQTLTGVSKLGDELHREVDVRDVTEQFTDLEVRLRNAEVVRQRLEALLAKAGSVEDALAVERELARLTQSIELWKGKLKLLRELVAFSTITVNFQVRTVEHVKSDVALPFEWLRQLGLSNLLSL